MFFHFLALWIAHYTLDEDLKVKVILENVACSNKKRRCVMAAMKEKTTDHYRLVGKVCDTLDFLKVLSKPPLFRGEFCCGKDFLSLTT